MTDDDDLIHTIGLQICFVQVESDLLLFTHLYGMLLTYGSTVPGGTSTRTTGMKTAAWANREASRSKVKAATRSGDTNALDFADSYAFFRNYQGVSSSEQMDVSEFLMLIAQKLDVWMRALNNSPSTFAKNIREIVNFTTNHWCSSKRISQHIVNSGGSPKLRDRMRKSETCNTLIKKVTLPIDAFYVNINRLLEGSCGAAVKLNIEQEIGSMGMPVKESILNTEVGSGRCKGCFLSRVNRCCETSYKVSESVKVVCVALHGELKDRENIEEIAVPHRLTINGKVYSLSVILNREGSTAKSGHWRACLRLPSLSVDEHAAYLDCSDSVLNQFSSSHRRLYKQFIGNPRTLDRLIYNEVTERSSQVS